MKTLLPSASLATCYGPHDGVQVMELKPVLRLDLECTAVQPKTDRWATASAWADKHKALLGLLIDWRQL
jgi:hypothetical protein